MITKILFTLGLIALVLFWVRNKPRPVETAFVTPRPVPSNGLRRLAWGLVGVVLVVLMVWGYWHWQQAHEVVWVRVIDIGSGHETWYEVRRGAVHERGFETLDGRRVILADSERMEVGGKP